MTPGVESASAAPFTDRGLTAGTLYAASDRLAEHDTWHRAIAGAATRTAWWDQLTLGGRLVVPLRWRGQTRAIAFTRTDSYWRSDWVELCGFVPMIGQNGEHSGTIDPQGQVHLYWDEDQPIDPAALRGVLDQPKTTSWSGAIIGPNEPFDGVWLRLTATETGTCRIAAEQPAVDSGRCTPAIASRSPAIVLGESLAYFTLRRLDDESGKRRWELGAIGHGATVTTSPTEATGLPAAGANDVDVAVR